jgi:hypothetical protein
MGDGRGTSYFYWGQILTLDSSEKDPNCWLKMSSWSVKIGCKKTDWVGLFGAMVVGTTSQQELLWGVVQCQAIIIV